MHAKPARSNGDGIAGGNPTTGLELSQRREALETRAERTMCHRRDLCQDAVGALRKRVVRVAGLGSTAPENLLMHTPWRLL